MCRLKDMEGFEFNGCKVISRAGVDKWGQATWECLCECGNTFVATGGNIRSGNTNSCGCFKVTKTREINTTHGDSRTRLYNIWYGIKRRCYSPSHGSYKHYGKRGITMSEEWKSDYNSFKCWALSNGYEEDLTIDRIDNDGNYTASNCRWVDMKTQGRNRRGNRFIKYDGRDVTLAELIEMTGLPESTVRNRLAKGIPLNSPRYFNRKNK